MENVPPRKVPFIWNFKNLNSESNLNFLAAAEQGIVYVMSTFATSSFEEIAQAAPEGNNWFQLCVFRDRYLILFC